MSTTHRSSFRRKAVPGSLCVFRFGNRLKPDPRKRAVPRPGTAFDAVNPYGTKHLEVAVPKYKSMKGTGNRLLFSYFWAVPALGTPGTAGTASTGG